MSGSTVDWTDPVEGSTRLGAPPPAAASSDQDPVEASTRLGALNTSWDKVPSNDHGAGVVRDLGLGTRDAIKGIAGLPAMVLDAAGWPGRALIHLGGGTVTAPSTALDNGLDALGLPTPQTPGEKTRSAIAEGGASMIGPQLVASVPRLAAAVPAMIRPMLAPDLGASRAAPVVQTVAGAAGGGAGEALASSDYVPEALKPAARLAGNVIGAGGVSALSGAAGTLLNAYNGVKTPIAEALERLGITPRTAGAVSSSPSVQQTEAAFSGAPISRGMLQPAQRQMVDDFGQAVENTARLVDPPDATGNAPRITSAQSAGEVVQKELHNWAKVTFPAQQDAAWAPLNQRLAGASVDPSGYRAALEYAASPPGLASLPENQRAFASQQAKKWLDALNADAPPGQSLSWEQAQALKQRIGDAMGTPDIVSSIGGTQLKRIYAGLADGMSQTATQHGQGGLFSRANQVTIDGHQFMDGTMSKALARNNETQETIRPDNAAAALLNDNVALQQLRDRVPAAADALAAWKLRQIQTAKPSAPGDTSIGSFRTELRKQYRNDPEGTAALFSDPSVSGKVDDLARVADQFHAVEQNANTSRTGATNLVLGLGGMAGSSYMSGGLPGLAATLGTTLGAPWAAGRALTNPTAIRLASTPPGPRAPIDSRVAGLLGYLAH